MGATLFDNEWDAAASRPRSGNVYLWERDELFKRRLAEARAFGAASEQLSSQHPEFSVRWGLNAKQRIIGFLLTVGFGAWLFLQPLVAAKTLAISIAVAFGLIIALRFWTALAAFFRKPPAETLRTRNDELPSLTILVPLYREAEVVPNLIYAISRLDYPSWRLDVKLLVEADNPGTIAPVEAQRLPDCF